MLAEWAIVLSVSLVIRWLISLNLYSGAQKAPMYGDFEAQRHWMEITYNLPTDEWYRNTSNNDLMYWGLDYPPLTAYHSWALGHVANHINASWVALHSSRGLESREHKIFMRITVIVSDLLIFIPAVFVYFTKCCRSDSLKRKAGMVLLTLLYPGLLLIDHGHFQYNSISLGLFLWALIFILKDMDCLGAITYVLALNYKQMELYHAIPFFCYLLGICFRGKQFWLWKLFKIGFVVLGTFALCWLPFLGNLDSTLQVLHRMFPFARGLYEDKVANVWCTLSIIIKFKQIMDTSNLIKLCLLSTVLAILPSSLNLLLWPTKNHFKLALVNGSLAFFLFSFQVHEKSILIPALSVCTILPQYPFAAVWFLLISTFSMLPLLLKDTLLIPYVATMGIFFLSIFVILGSDLPHTSPQHKGAKSEKNIPFWPSTSIFLLFVLSLVGAFALTVASLTVSPPAELPDIFPVLISIYSCGHYVMFGAYFHWKQLAGDGGKAKLKSN